MISSPDSTKCLIVAAATSLEELSEEGVGEDETATLKRSICGNRRFFEQRFGHHRWAKD